MLIAQQLKKTNICEYILYMWQIEDIIRAFNFSIENIEKNVISRFTSESIDNQKIVFEWYESLIDMMRSENIKEIGHLQLNQNTVSELVEFHHLLFKSGRNAGYNAKFIHILPFVEQLRSQQNNKNLSEIEICFNFLYGILILKMKQKNITTETKKAQEEISKYMSLLSKNFHSYKNGDLDFEEEI